MCFCGDWWFAAFVSLGVCENDFGGLVSWESDLDMGSVRDRVKGVGHVVGARCRPSIEIETSQ